MDKNKGRSSFIPMLALLKKHIVAAFETITRSQLFKVRLENDKVFYSYLNQISGRIERLGQVFQTREPLAPVTHISVNALNGTIKIRSVTVTTALTSLPGEVLADRRSIIIFNNSSQTVEIGGSTFTFGKGLPILANSYSPMMDVGKNTILYGRVTSGTADVRTLEISSGR